MGQGQFDERLERVIHAARVRLMERLREAYFHGYAEKLLRHYHLADALLEARSGDGLLPLAKAAADLLEARIRRVRRGGYLAAYLRSYTWKICCGRGSTQRSCSCREKTRPRLLLTLLLRVGCTPRFAA